MAEWGERYALPPGFKLSEWAIHNSGKHRCSLCDSCYLRIVSDFVNRLRENEDNALSWNTVIWLGGAVLVGLALGWVLALAVFGAPS